MKHRLPPALRLRSFALLWSASLATGLATQMVAVAVGWQVYAIHHDPLDLGLVGLAEFAPLPLLALPAGQLVDRVSRRVLAAAAVAFHICIVGVLLAVTVAGLTALWPYLCIGALAGAMSSFSSPATSALMPELVPGELLQGAIALRTVAGRIGIVVGPTLGGVLFAVEPLSVYATAAGMLALALAALVAMPPTVSRRSDEPVRWDSVVAGLRFVLRTRMILGAILLDLVAVLLGDAIALAPVFARTILDIGPVGLGALRTAPSLGALASGALITRRPLQRRAGPTLLVVVAVFGAATIVFGLSRSLPLSLAALFVTGFADMYSMTIRETTIAVVTPLDLQGRVLAVESVFISASNELGAFESGGMASLVGTTRAVVLGGALMIASAASWPKLFPALSRMGRLDDLRPAPAAGAGG